MSKTAAFASDRSTQMNAKVTDLEYAQKVFADLLQALGSARFNQIFIVSKLKQYSAVISLFKQIRGWAEYLLQMPYDPDLTRINAHGPFHRSRNHPTLAIPDVYEVATKMWKALTEEEKQQYFVEAKPTSSKSKETLVARCAPKRFIKTVMKESNMLHMIGFIDPFVTGALGCGNSTERSRSLSDAFKRGKPGQIFLAPYNSGYHWILTVVNTTEDLVYYMDPSKRRMDVTTDEWKTIVNQFIKQTNYLIQGIPEQIGDKTCGYFIMLYRREIVLDKNQDWSKKWLTRGDAYYTMGNVDVVREEWAKYVLKFTNN